MGLLWRILHAIRRRSLSRAPGLTLGYLYTGVRNSSDVNSYDFALSSLHLWSLTPDNGLILLRLLFNDYLAPTYQVNLRSKKWWERHPDSYWDAILTRRLIKNLCLTSMTTHVSSAQISPCLWVETLHPCLLMMFYNSTYTICHNTYQHIRYVRTRINTYDMSGHGSTHTICHNTYQHIRYVRTRINTYDMS